jgi:hypothetical protein
MGDVLANRLGRPVFTWSGGALADAGGIRATYIGALQAADNFDFTALTQFARA